MMAGIPEQVPQGAPDRSRRVFVWWGVAFIFLALLGLFCLLVAKPVAEVRGVAEGLLPAPMAGYFPERASVEAAVARLGGPEQAARKIWLYLRVPEQLGGEYRWTAGLMLGRCGKPGLRELRRLLADPADDRFQYGWWGAMAFDCYYRGSPPDWKSHSAMETAARDPDPEIARLAGEIARILNVGPVPKPSPGPPMRASPLR
jgi:hypothetical protein